MFPSCQEFIVEIWKWKQNAMKEILENDIYLKQKSNK